MLHKSSKDSLQILALLDVLEVFYADRRFL